MSAIQMQIYTTEITWPGNPISSRAAVTASYVALIADRIIPHVTLTSSRPVSTCTQVVKKFWQSRSENLHSQRIQLGTLRRGRFFESATFCRGERNALFRNKAL